KGKISDAVVKRLPIYRRYLEELIKDDVERISSNELSSLIGFTASQIRQDLNNFGGFGQQGYGYNIKGLYKEITTILGLDCEYKMVIVGTGNLGQALANYTKYYKTGFPIVGMFDINPKIIGLKINDIQVHDSEYLSEFLKENAIDIGIITTDKSAAQNVANQLVEGGVRGIWNFAPCDLKVPKYIPVENVHVTDTLNSLVYHIIHNNETDEK
ncbi:MAG: redox-sensing transcriptional repressor Rex, partial [Firmicutes bacterium]|nr:redox-sensing transcriptional repressor Rex [Bacillota bacterium]